jgi:hypothetical protein
LSVIPTDPVWQPTREAAERTTGLLRAFAPEADPVDVYWYDKINLVEAGENLERIGCPTCGRHIDPDWWGNLVDETKIVDDGFTDLTVTVPCCASRTSLNDLDYHWPTGYARFELAAWNPDRDWLTSWELTDLAGALGHDVRQIRARI